MKLRREIKQSLFCCIVGICFVLMLPSFSSAEDGKKESAEMKSAEVKGTIVRKRPEYIQTDNYLYIVDGNTKIYYPAPKKRKISLEDLPISCEALIKLELMNWGNHRAKEIMIINVIEPSTTEWSPPLPE